MLPVSQVDMTMPPLCSDLPNPNKDKRGSKLSETSVEVRGVFLCFSLSTLLGSCPMNLENPINIIASEGGLGTILEMGKCLFSALGTPQMHFQGMGGRYRKM